jgi:hypothetical protein
MFARGFKKLIEIGTLACAPSHHVHGQVVAWVVVVTAQY